VVAEHVGSLFRFQAGRNERFVPTVGRFLGIVTKCKMYDVSMGLKFQGFILITYCRL